MAVPDEDDGGGLFRGCGWCVDEAAACHALHGEFQLLNSWRKLNLSMAGRNEGQQTEGDREESHHGVKAVNQRGWPELQRTRQPEEIKSYSFLISVYL